MVTGVKYKFLMSFEFNNAIRNDVMNFELQCNIV